MTILLLLFVWNCCCCHCNGLVIVGAHSDRARRFRSAETGRNCAETRSAVFCSPPYSYTHGTGDLLYTSSRAAAQTAEAERADEES